MASSWGRDVYVRDNSSLKLDWLSLSIVEGVIVLRHIDLKLISILLGQPAGSNSSESNDNMVMAITS